MSSDGAQAAAWRHGIRSTPVTLDGISTRRLETVGSGTPVLLLHGYTDSADTWRALLAQFDIRGRKAVAVDLPGHGRAASPRANSLDALDTFVRASIAEVDSGSGVVLVGNSLGALLALRAARDRAPGLLSVFAIAPPADRLHLGLDLLPRWGYPLATLLCGPVPDRVLARTAARLFSELATAGQLSPRQRDRYEFGLGRARVRGLLRLGSDIVGEIHDGDRLPATYDIPVTMLWGGLDEVCPAPDLPTADSSTTVILLDDLPHCPQLTHPRRTLEAFDAHERRTPATQLRRGRYRSALPGRPGR